MERRKIDAPSYQHCMECDVVCYERGITIAWNDEQVSDELMRSVTDDAYDRWMNVEDNPEVESWCCEEYILHEVDKLGIEYDYCFYDWAEGGTNTMNNWLDGPWRNDACKGYALMAMKRVGLDEETIRMVSGEMTRCFDDTTVAEAADYYLKGGA